MLIVPTEYASSYVPELRLTSMLTVGRSEGSPSRLMYWDDCGADSSNPSTVLVLRLRSKIALTPPIGRLGSLGVTSSNWISECNIVLAVPAAGDEGLDLLVAGPSGTDGVGARHTVPTNVLFAADARVRVPVGARAMLLIGLFGLVDRSAQGLDSPRSAIDWEELLAWLPASAVARDCMAAAAMLLPAMTSVIAESSSRRSTSSRHGRRSRRIRRPIFSSLRSRAGPDHDCSDSIRSRHDPPATTVLSESMLCRCRTAVSRYCLTTSL